MPSIELNQLAGVSAPRALSASDRPAVETRTPARAAAPGQPPVAGISVEVGAVSDATTPPVDAERVAQIRNALRDGSYPLVPTKIADAMIAAQVSLSLPDRD